MLDFYDLIDRKIFFRDPGVNVMGENVFTILVGKNGSGKSQLLRSVLLSLVGDSLLVGVNLQERFKESVSPSKFVFSGRPKSVIASSVSPFDKFPISKSKNRAGYYRYLGLKGLSSMNLGAGFMSRTISSLVDVLVSCPERFGVVGKIFDYLNYDFYLRSRVQLDIPLEEVQVILGSGSSHDAFFSALRSRYGSVEFSQSNRFNYSEDEVESIISALSHVLAQRGERRKGNVKFDFFLTKDGVFLESGPIDGSTLILLRSGLLVSKEISLSKKGVGKPFHIKDASSGEQSVLLSLLGIASHIVDGSLVLIDEPEICLHPEWQERYIELLVGLFSSFVDCHFIIATHSPQIVSGVGDRNCYVLDVQSGEMNSAASFNKRSADFQLANLFSAPGYKNEYLSREVIGVLMALSRREELSPQRRESVEKMVRLLPLINSDDPNFKLISMLADVMESS
ncbi:ATP-binding protein [Pseudomonas sp. GD04087]|uniref:AAA family ATPase n=1 Tax=unclassified Pseudomonas TaxID=196821 RepID=UPI00244B750F|nr:MULTISPECIES: AAA family ATPase [unclassified Pseudomonas]MDH0293099.1 ATP-binding protein [Pseudomonas sp. GD04087]MDH1052282.1 ATP-binding protein [Pseudomonas sp. GD03903]MDH2003334.1 ATP-binding protein [Pseudomonas sp. GD03691]